MAQFKPNAAGPYQKGGVEMAMRPEGGMLMDGASEILKAMAMEREEVMRGKAIDGCDGYTKAWEQAYRDSLLHGTGMLELKNDTVLGCTAKVVTARVVKAPTYTVAMDPAVREDKHVGALGRRQHVSDQAYAEYVARQRKRGEAPASRSEVENLWGRDGLVILTVAEHDELLVLRREVHKRASDQNDLVQDIRARDETIRMLQRHVSRLEAENEALSRQLRSREINAEPVAKPRPLFRWSPQL